MGEAAYTRKDSIGQFQEYPNNGSILECCYHLLERFEYSEVLAALETVRYIVKRSSISSRLSRRDTPPIPWHKADGTRQEEVSFIGRASKSASPKSTELFSGVTANGALRISAFRPAASQIDKLHSMEEFNIGIWYLLFAYTVDTFSPPIGSLKRGQGPKSVAYMQIRETRGCCKGEPSKLYLQAQKYEEYVKEGDLIALQLVPRLHSWFVVRLVIWVGLTSHSLKEITRTAIPKLVESHRKYLPKKQKDINRGNFQVATTLLYHYLDLGCGVDNIIKKSTALTQLLCRWIDIDFFLERGHVRPSHDIGEIYSGEQYESDSDVQLDFTNRGLKRRRSSQESYVVSTSSELSAPAANVTSAELRRAASSPANGQGPPLTPTEGQSWRTEDMFESSTVSQNEVESRASTTSHSNELAGATRRPVLVSQYAQRLATATRVQQKQAVPFPYTYSDSESSPHFSSPLDRINVSSQLQLLLLQIGAALDQAFESFHVSERGFFSKETGAPARSTLCDEFDSYCFTATKFRDKGMRKRYLSALDKAGTFILPMLEVEHPRTLSCFFEVLIHLCQSGLIAVARTFCAYIQQVSTQASAAERPFIQACRSLDRLDEESFQSDMETAWGYIADTFDRKLRKCHTVAISVRLDYVKRVYGVSNPVEEEKILRDLVQTLVDDPGYATPRVRHNLAHNLIRQGRYRDAREIATLTGNVLLDPHHSERVVEQIELCKIMAHSYYGEGAMEDAVWHLQQTIEKTKGLLGEQHAWVVEFNLVLNTWRTCKPSPRGLTSRGKGEE